MTVLMNHPEIREGEVFLGNVVPNEHGKFDTSFCGFHSKRLGEIAYDKSGGVITDGKPLFAEKKEQEEFKRMLNAL